MLNLLPKTIIDKNNDFDYHLSIDMVFNMPRYTFVDDCYLSDFPYDFGKNLVENLVKSVEWLKEHKYM